VQAAWVVLIRPQSWERHGLKSWIESAKTRLPHNVLAIPGRRPAARLVQLTKRVGTVGLLHQIVQGLSFVDGRGRTKESAEVK
jgi:hypothetical protein